MMVQKIHPASNISKVANISKVTVWKLKLLPDESAKPPQVSDNSPNPRINYFANAR